MPSRRRFLAAVAAVAGTGGCSVLDSPAARIERVRFENGDSTAREFAFTVAVDGETSYEATHTVPAAGDSEPMPELTGELPDESGRVTVETTVRGTDASRSTTFEDDDCYDLIVEYTGEHVTHWRHASDECESNTET